MAMRKDATGDRPKNRRLGRGLSSLLSAPVSVPMPGKQDEDAPPLSAPDSSAEHGAGEYAITLVPLDRIEPNRHQPRQDFDEGSLKALADSIRAAGLMQPVVVRPAGGGRYELIAGERRWRAAQLVGLDRLPAVVRKADDRTAAEWALIENLQREDLNPVERAEAFRRLAEEFSLSHQEIADHVGLDRSTVTNHLRLLELDQETLDDLRQNRLTVGHARSMLAITNITDRRRIARRAMQGAWSVRRLEQEIRRGTGDGSAAAVSATRRDPASLHLEHLQEGLGRHLGTRVRIETGRRKGSGRVIIDFYSLDEFESLMKRLDYKPD